LKIIFYSKKSELLMFAVQIYYITYKHL